MSKFVVRRTITGPFDSIFSRAAEYGDKFAAALGCDGYTVAYGEFVYLKDTIFRTSGEDGFVTKPEFKVIIRFTITKQD